MILGTWWTEWVNVEGAMVALLCLLAGVDWLWWINVVMMVDFCRDSFGLGVQWYTKVSLFFPWKGWFTLYLVW